MGKERSGELSCMQTGLVISDASYYFLGISVIRIFKYLYYALMTHKPVFQPDCLPAEIISFYIARSVEALTLLGNIQIL